MIPAFRQATQRALLGFQQFSPATVARRARFCSTATPEEQQISQRLREQLPGASSVRVTDTSGGCGSMYRLEVVADEFRGIGVVKQHQLVAKLLDKEIKSWHGFTMVTKPTPTET